MCTFSNRCFPTKAINGWLSTDDRGHCAIVAREYGLPCVVSTIVGTGIIEDGMTLTVDGSSGIVRIDSRT